MAKTKKDISFVTWGDVHKDPGSPNVLLVKIKELVASGIPVVFCAEAPKDHNLDTRIKTFEDILVKYNTYIQNPAIKKLMKKHPTLGIDYFDEKDYEAIQIALHDMLGNKYTLNDYRYLNEHHAFREYWNLLMYLKASNIPYVGIEATAAERQKLVTGGYDQNYLIDNENSRIDIMVDNVKTSAVPALKEGGVVIAKVGAVHSKRLASHLVKEYENNDEVEGKFFALTAYSNYDPQQKFFTQQSIKDYERIDSGQIKDCAKSVSTVEASLLNTESGLKSKEVDDVFTSATKNLSPSSSIKPGATTRGKDEEVEK